MQKGELQCSGRGWVVFGYVSIFAFYLRGTGASKCMRCRASRVAAWKLDCKLSFVGFAGNGQEVKVCNLYFAGLEFN
jgi:hypothetical protein